MTLPADKMISHSSNLIDLLLEMSAFHHLQVQHTMTTCEAHSQQVYHEAGLGEKETQKKEKEKKGQAFRRAARREMCTFPSVFHQDKERKRVAGNRVLESWFTCVRICESVFIQKQEWAVQREKHRDREIRGGRERTNACVSCMCLCVHAWWKVGWNYFSWTAEGEKGRRMNLCNSLCQKKLEGSVNHFILLTRDILVTAFWSSFFSQSDGNERTGV